MKDDNLVTSLCISI